MIEVVIAIAGALIKGLCSVIGLSVENSARTEVEAAKRETRAVLETANVEREIMEHVLEVEREGVDPADIFAPSLPSASDVVPV